MRIVFEVPVAEVNEHYQSALKHVANRVTIKGFRKGKAPHNILEKHYGQDIIDETTSSALKHALNELYKADDVKPISYDEPMIKIIDGYKKGQKLRCVVEFDVYPDVQLGSYRNLTISVIEKRVMVADVQQRLEAIRNKHASLQSLTKERPIVYGDCVLCDTWKTIHGEVTERQDGAYIVIDRANYDEDTRAMIGLRKGDTKQLPSGRWVRVRDIFKRNVPKIDDALAQDFDENIKTVAELKEHIREQLRVECEQKNERERRGAILNRIVSHSTIDLPKSMIGVELKNILNIMAEHENLSIDKFIERIEKRGESVNKFYDTLAINAEQNLREALVLLEIYKRENLTVDKEEMDDYIVKHMEIPEEEKRILLARFYADNSNSKIIETFHAFLRDRKTYEHLFAINTCVAKRK